MYSVLEISRHLHYAVSNLEYRVSKIEIYFTLHPNIQLILISLFNQNLPYLSIFSFMYWSIFSTYALHSDAISFKIDSKND